MCESPLLAWVDLETVTATGKNPILFKLPDSVYQLACAAGQVSSRYKQIQIPCGKCFQCRKSRAYDLTVRAVFESRCYDHNSFITLTVNDDNLLKVFPNGVEHRPWQLFAKRLRKLIGPFRFLMCAEYGSKSNRPHYHAIIFGHEFHDEVSSDDGCSFIPSARLQACWPFGHVQVSDVNENRIAYVAGYTLKDYQLGRDRDWYTTRGLSLPYVRWSRRPGLGFYYFDMYWSTLIKSNSTWKDGDLVKSYHQEFVLGKRLSWFNIRYFNEKLALSSPELSAKIRAANQDYLLHQSFTEQLIKHDDIRRNTLTNLYRLSQKERNCDC